MFQVVFGRVLRVFGCVQLMCMREVSVVSGLLVVARVMMLCRLRMVMGRQSVMMGRLTMFVRCLL
jgi:hypothetical protein